MAGLIRQLTKKDWERIVQAVGVQDEAAVSRYEHWTSTYRKVKRLQDEITKYRLDRVAVEPVNCPHGIHSPYECSTCQGVRNDD